MSNKCLQIAVGVFWRKAQFTVKDETVKATEKFLKGHLVKLEK